MTRFEEVREAATDSLDDLRIRTIGGDASELVQGSTGRKNTDSRAVRSGYRELAEPATLRPAPFMEQPVYCRLEPGFGRRDGQYPPNRLSQIAVALTGPAG